MPRCAADFEAEALAALLRLAALLARHEPHDGGEAVDGADEELALRVVAEAAPVEAAGVARRLDRALQADRGEWTLGAQRGDPAPGRLHVPPASRPRRRRGSDSRRPKSGELRREGLRRPGLLARDVRLRHGALLDREERLARLAVENEDVSLLVPHRDRRHRLAVAAQARSGRLHRHVVVPDVVVDGLEVPDQLAGRGAQGDDAVGEEVLRRGARRRSSRGWAPVGTKTRPRSGSAEIGAQALAPPVLWASGPFQVS